MYDLIEVQQSAYRSSTYRASLKQTEADLFTKPYQPSSASDSPTQLQASINPKTLMDQLKSATSGRIKRAPKRFDEEEFATPRQLAAKRQATKKKAQAPVLKPAASPVSSQSSSASLDSLLAAVESNVGLWLLVDAADLA